MLMTSSAPLYAAPAANALPQAAANWVQAGAATQATAGNTLTVNQTTNKAILNWQNFNIGRDAAVQFNQPSSSSIALNKIGGGSASEIFGRLGANGNLYLINNNGILFGAGSQVNVHGLVASTLNIDENRFLTSSLPQAINDGQAALSGGTAAGAMISVESGAKIQTDSGGQVLMFAPTVINAGEISTPDGQTILAASHDRVYLTTSDKDPDLRGLLVEVDTGGDVSNVGTIVAERGNVTLLGLAVNQNGRIRATTSIDVNGSVRLLARDRAQVLPTKDIGAAPNTALLVDTDSERPTSTNVAVATRSGTVTLGSGSIIEIAADEQLAADGSVKTAVDAQPQNKSRVDIVGKTIVLQDGASILAKSGNINLRATTTPNTSTPTTRNDSRIYVGKNVSIDVSGEDVLLPMSRRTVEVELRGSQLADSPLQKNGKLRGQTVYVDVDKGSPLIADMAPEIAKIKRDVKERSVEGGTVNFVSQGDVIFGGESKIDISGGSKTYEAGYLKTSKLLAGSRIIDIGDADPNLTYDGILGGYTENHPKWGKLTFGQNSIFARGEYREGFTDGQAGGVFKVDTAAMYGFDLLNINAAAHAGIYQRDLSSAPRGGSIAILLGVNQPDNSALGAVQDTIIQRAASSAAAASDISLDLGGGNLRAATIAADKISRSGAGNFSLSTIGSINLAADATLQMQPGTTVALTGTALQIDGGIKTAGGSIALASRASYGNSNLGNYPIVVGSGALLDTSGSWVNDLLEPTSTALKAINGGSISVEGVGDVNIAAGSQLRADAGGYIARNGTFAGGDGGSISLVTRARTDNDAGSRLLVNGELSAYGFGNGGSLNLTANAFQIGGTTADSRTVLLAPEFFSQGGFSRFALNANFGSIDVAPATAIQLTQKNLALNDINSASRQRTGADVRSFSERVVLPQWLRKAVDLTLSVADNISTNKGNSPTRALTIGRDAQINAEPGAKVSLRSDRSIFVDGKIDAPGGDIALEITTPNITVDTGYIANQAIWLGDHAQLSAKATQVSQENAAGLRLGKIYDAGTVSFTANRGSVVAAPGAVIDVSGAAFVQDYLSTTARTGVRSANISAAAGSISLKAAESIFNYADMRGFAAGSDGLGGRLSISLDSNQRGSSVTESPFLYTPRVLSISSTLPAWNSALAYGSVLPSGTANVSAEQVHAGGFSQLELGATNLKSSDSSSLAAAGRISFVDDVTLTLKDSLSLNSTNIALNNHNVTVNAGIVGVGQASGDNILQGMEAVQTGTGRLNVNAKFIELLGNIGVSGTNQIALNSTGDIRVRSHIDNGTGRVFNAATFKTTGDLTLAAAQIYPATLTDYLFDLTGTNSTFKTLGTGTPTPLLSAGGTVRVKAANIDHGGVIAAPLGTVALQATNSINLRAGSVIDVSGNNQLIPFGRLQGGDISWIYPLDPAHPLVIEQAPEKQVLLDAKDVAMEQGSRVELSGGGDIYAIEQVPGPGGSKDFLDAAYAEGAFAVIPALNSQISPYDSIEMRGTGIKLGQTIYLEGGNGLPAGEYAVLPAHYALLPGAYLISPSGKTVAQGTTVARTDGVPLVSGRFGRAFAAQYGAEWQGFYVEPGAAARTRTEYTEAKGDTYFANNGSDRAADAGLISIAARERLQLDGTIGASAQNGHGAQMDIIANLLEIISDNSGPGEAGAVRVNADSLSRIGVDSLLLGGSRRRDGDGIAINVGAQRVTIASGAQLAAPDLILAANDRVRVESGASVAGTGQSSQNYSMINVDAHSGSGEGALLRVSSAGQVDVKRNGTIASNSANGALEILAGANVGADKSMLFDATGAMKLDGALNMQGGSLNVSANRISLGEGIGNVEGAVFDNAKLASLTPETLRFSSRSSIDFYGDVNFNNQRAEFNAGALRAMTPGAVKVSATDTMQLSNTAGVSATAATDASGSLTLAARAIELGSVLDKGTAMLASGFERVQLGVANLTQQISGNGDFTFGTSKQLDVVADRITGGVGSSTQLKAGGDIALVKANAAAITESSNALGAALSIEGARIDQRTAIVLPSGSVALNATSGDVVLGDGSSIDVSGRAVQFPNNVVRTDGGEIRLRSIAGNVIAEAGSSVNISGAGPETDVNKQGAAAGVLDVSAANGNVQWNGSINAAGGNGSAGGSVKLDGSTIADLSGWLTRIADAGINKLVSIRARTGDVAIDRNMTAQSIDIAADAGNLSVASTLDASGSDGGSIVLSASDNLALTNTAQLLARANGENARGGRVELTTRGNNNGVLDLANGSHIDVSGNGGRNGQVILRAPRTAANDDVAINDSGVMISGAERIDVIGTEVRSGISSINASLIAQIDSVATSFMTHAATIQTRLNNLFGQGAHLRPGVEITNTGDISIANTIDFSTLRYGADQEGAEFVVRAGRNITLQGSLLDGYTAAHDSISDGVGIPYNTLFSGKAWDFHLVAGADLGASNSSSVLQGVGDLRLSSGADVITGAGDVWLQAGRDLIVDDATSVIASLGSQPFTQYTSLFDSSLIDSLADTGTFDPYLLFLAGLRFPFYPEHGGNVTLTAGQDVRFAKSSNYFGDWIKRVGGEVEVFDGINYTTFNLTTWGVLIDDIQNQQGIAVFGGGNLNIDAGRDAVNVFATVASTGKQDGVGLDQNGKQNNHVSVIGGGNASVIAGRDILSPRVMVEKGELTLKAGRDIGASGTGTTDFNAVLALADTIATLQAGRDIKIDAVVNSTVMPQSTRQVDSNLGGQLPENYFFTYSDRAKLQLQTLGGDIQLLNRSVAVNDAFSAHYANSSVDKYAYAIYPGSLTANAMQNSIFIKNEMTLFPSSRGQLILNAAQDVVGIAGATTAILILSDADPATLPTMAAPSKSLGFFNALKYDDQNQWGYLTHAAKPVHYADKTFAIINALYGDIRGAVENSTATFRLNINKAVKAVAGRDISYVNFYIQHASDDQASELIAGRDFGFPLQLNSEGNLALSQTRTIEVAGPGRLDIIAGRDIDLGGSNGIDSIGNQKNPALTDSGADITLMAGINGATAFSDPLLFAEFSARYLDVSPTLSGSFVDWFGAGNFGGDISTLVGSFTGKSYGDKNSALTAYRGLPVLTQQAIALAGYEQQFSNSSDYSAKLIDFVSLDRFGGDLVTIVNNSLQPAQPYTTRAQAAAALALLPAAQQQQIALQALIAAAPSARRELVSTVLFDEVRAGGVEGAQNAKGIGHGLSRSRAALDLMFPNDQWQGEINLVLSSVRTLGDGDINLLVPGGAINVGLATNINGLTKSSDKLGIIAQRYGSINGIAKGDINVNQSRIFSLDGGDITLWSSVGSVDAGRGAKTALTIPPPTVKIDPVTGNTILEFPPAVSGSGIQTASNTRKKANDRGALVDDAIVTSSSDTRTLRQRYYRSLKPGDVYLFAPEGFINAGDAGILAAGGFIGVGEIRGADNIKVGGVSIGIPTTTGVGAGTLSLGDVASSATESATNSMNDAIKEAAAALAESSAAFVTVDVIGVGN
ncbi:MAG: filamentous hemagglutinin family protein [Spongiibacteraceae bacterium]